MSEEKRKSTKRSISDPNQSGFGLGLRLSGSGDSIGSEKTLSSSSCPKLQRLDVPDEELEASRQRRSSFGGSSTWANIFANASRSSGSPKSHSPQIALHGVKTEESEAGQLAGAAGVGWNLPAAALEEQQQNAFSLLLAQLQQLYATQQIAAYLQAMAIAQPNLLALCPQLFAAAAAQNTAVGSTLSAATASASSPTPAQATATVSDAALAGVTPILLSRLFQKPTLPLAHGTWSSQMTIPSLAPPPAAALNAKPASLSPLSNNTSVASAAADLKLDRLAIASATDSGNAYDPPSHLRCLSALQLSGTAISLEMSKASDEAMASSFVSYARGKERERARSGPTGGAAKGLDEVDEQPQIEFLKMTSAAQRPSLSTSESSCKSESGRESTPVPEKVEPIEPRTPNEESEETNSYLYYKKKKRAACSASTKSRSERSSSTMSASPTAATAAAPALKCAPDAAAPAHVGVVSAFGARERERENERTALRPSMSMLLTPSNSVPSLSSSARSPSATPTPSSEFAPVSLPHFFPNVPLPPAHASTLAPRVLSIEQISPATSQSEPTTADFRVWKPYSEKDQ